MLTFNGTGEFLWFTLTFNSFTQTLEVQCEFLQFTLTFNSFTQTLGAQGEFLQFTLTIHSFTQTLECKVCFYGLHWPFTVLPKHWELTVSFYSLRWPSAVLPKHWECKIKHTQKIEKNTSPFIKSLSGVSVPPTLPWHWIRFLVHDAKQRADGLWKIWSWWGSLLCWLPWLDMCFATWVAHQWSPAHNGERISDNHADIR